MAIVLEPLRGPAEMQGIGLSNFHTWVRLTEQVDQGPLQRLRLLESLLRGTPYSRMYEGSQDGVVAGYTQSLKII